MKAQLSKQRQEECEYFIQLKWVNIALAAYDGYMKVGRGMVMVRESDFIGKSQIDCDDVSTSYRGIDELVANHAPWIGDAEAELLRSYDPSKSAVIGVVQENTIINCYHFMGSYPIGTPVILWHASNGSLTPEMEKGV